MGLKKGGVIGRKIRGRVMGGERGEGYGREKGEG